MTCAIMCFLYNVFLNLPFEGKVTEFFIQSGPTYGPKNFKVTFFLILSNYKKNYGC